MERKMYQFTDSKLRRFARRGMRTWAEAQADLERTPEQDAAMKASWAKRHGGKTRGWGLAKRQLALDTLRNTIDYQQGLWQGRVDKANGLPYCEERLKSPYNMGYYQGYDEYESNRRGWDSATRARFDEQNITE